MVTTIEGAPKTLLNIGEELKSAKAKAYSDQKYPNDYNTRRGIDGYENFLPLFSGKAVTAIIDNKRKKRPTSVLDLGCGAGLFLRELRNIFPEIALSGLTAYDYRRSEPEFMRVIPFPSDIDIRVGDAHNLRRIFSGNKFDVITSVWTFQYLEDPLSVLKQCYSLLNPDGIAFLHQPGLAINFRQAVALKGYLQGQGINCNFGEESYRLYSSEPVSLDLAIQKSPYAQKLSLPFRYNHPGSILSERYTFTLAA